MPISDKPREDGVFALVLEQYIWVVFVIFGVVFVCGRTDTGLESRQFVIESWTAWGEVTIKVESMLNLLVSAAFLLVCSAFLDSRT